MARPQTAHANAAEKLGLCQTDDLELVVRRAACDALIGDLNEPADLRAEALLNRGIMLEDEDELAVALADFTTAIALNPEYPALYEHRGLLHLKMGNGVAALGDLGTAIRLVPDSAELHASRALVHVYLKDDNSALKDLGEAIRIEPEDADYHAQRGTVHWRLGLRAAAEADVRKALTLEPGHELATKILDELRKRG